MTRSRCQEEQSLDIVHKRAAGLVISKRDAKVCLGLPGQRAGTYTSTVTTWGATTCQILALRTSWNASSHGRHGSHKRLLETLLLSPRRNAAGDPIFHCDHPSNRSEQVAQLLQRQLDAKPPNWLTFRPSPIQRMAIIGQAPGGQDPGIEDDNTVPMFGMDVPVRQGAAERRPLHQCDRSRPQRAGGRVGTPSRPL